MMMMDTGPCQLLPQNFTKTKRSANSKSSINMLGTYHITVQEIKHAKNLYVVGIYISE